MRVDRDGLACDLIHNGLNHSTNSHAFGIRVVHKNPICIWIVLLQQSITKLKPIETVHPYLIWIRFRCVIQRSERGLKLNAGVARGERSVQSGAVPGRGSEVGVEPVVVDRQRRRIGRTVASRPRCKTTTGVGSFEELPTQEGDPHPCPPEYHPPSAFAPR